MSLGTKTFLVAAIMALVAIGGSIGAQDARAEMLEATPGHIAH